jgi:HAMP domain-containing protein
MSLAQRFLNLKLRLKLILAFGSLLVLTIMLVAMFFSTLRQIEIHERLSEEADGVTIGLLQMNAAVRYFVLEGFKSDDFQIKNRSASLDIFSTQLKEINRHLDFIRSNEVLSAQRARILFIEQYLKTVSQQIDSLTYLVKERGFKDFGTEGELRKAIHSVEKSSYPYDKADMLTLRRHEKDFFLRRDLKYQKEFNASIETFMSGLEAKKSDENLIRMLGDLQRYKLLFNQIVALDQKIGLKETDGKKKEINSTLNQLQSAVIELRADIKATNEQFKKRSATILLSVVVVQLLLGALLAIVYANVITRAIKELKWAINDLSEGIFPKKLIVKSNEEIGKTKQSFNQLLERISAATKFAENLGQGKLDTKYADQFNNDILAISLIRMQRQLKEVEETQRIINWGNAGMAQLNEVMKNTEDNVAQFGDKVLSFLIKYVNASQGALYQVSEEDERIERIATHAYGKKKFMSEDISWGYGLIGQCAMEKETIILTSVPSDYIKITSGLGEALPAFVVIIPLMMQGRMVGILELASFEKMETFEIQFLERLSENIAAMLANRQLLAETNRALNDLTPKKSLNYFALSADN